EIVPYHRPDAGNITRSEKNLPVVSTEYLITEIEEASGDVDPHESQVPLQRATEPSAYSQRFWPVQQVFLRDFGAEAGKGAKNLQPAPHHHEQRDCVQPVAESHGPGMLIDCGRGLIRLRRFDFNYCFKHASRLQIPLQSVELRIALVFPIADLLQNVGHFQIGKILRLFVSNFGGNLQPQRRTMLPSQRLVIHLVAKQSLGMQRRGHVERLVVIVGAFNVDKARSSVGSNRSQEIRKPRAAKAADYIPTFHTNMSRIVLDFRQSLDLPQPIVPWFLYGSANGECPLIKVHTGVIDVVVIYIKLFDGRH